MKWNNYGIIMDVKTVDEVVAEYKSFWKPYEDAARTFNASLKAIAEAGLKWNVTVLPKTDDPNQRCLQIAIYKPDDDKSGKRVMLYVYPDNDAVTLWTDLESKP